MFICDTVKIGFHVIWQRSNESALFVPSQLCPLWNWHYRSNGELWLQADLLDWVSFSIVLPFLWFNIFLLSIFLRKLVGCLPQFGHSAREWKPENFRVKLETSRCSQIFRETFHAQTGKPGRAWFPCLWPNGHRAWTIHHKTDRISNWKKKLEKVKIFYLCIKTWLLLELRWDEIKVKTVNSIVSSNLRKSENENESRPTNQQNNQNLSLTN